MSFNLEGMLAGAGEGISKSATYLQDKYDRDFKERQSSIEYSRKMNLEDLRRKNNMNLATTQQGWRTDESALERGFKEDTASNLADSNMSRLEREYELKSQLENTKAVNKGNEGLSAEDQLKNEKLQLEIKNLKQGQTNYTSDQSKAADAFVAKGVELGFITTPEDAEAKRSQYLKEAFGSVSQNRTDQEATQSKRLNTQRTAKANEMVSNQTVEDTQEMATAILGGDMTASIYYDSLNKTNKAKVDKELKSLKSLQAASGRTEGEGALSSSMLSAASVSPLEKEVGDIDLLLQGSFNKPLAQVDSRIVEAKKAEIVATLREGGARAARLKNKIAVLKSNQ